MTVVREVESDHSEGFGPVDGPLFVLVAAYGDEELRSDVKSEVESIHEALGGGCDLKVLERPTVQQLSAAIAEGQPHVLHYIGTGVEKDFDPESQAIVLRNESGSRDLLLGEGLVDLLSTHGRGLRLVFLNACNTDVVAEVMARRAPAVLGVRGEYSDRSAVTLARGFYRELGQGAQLDHALAVARRDVNFKSPGSLDWSAPLLFLSGGGGSPLVKPGAPAESSALSPPSLETAAAEPSVSQLGRDVEREYLAARIEVDRRNIAALEAQARQLGDPTVRLAEPPSEPRQASGDQKHKEN
jgi:hypothetical protein